MAAPGGQREDTGMAVLHSNPGHVGLLLVEISVHLWVCAFIPLASLATRAYLPLKGGPLYRELNVEIVHVSLQ